MTTRLLLLGLLFNAYFISAQDNIIIYGLEQNFGNPTASNPLGEVESMDLVSINPTTGDKVTLFGIVDAESVAAGSSTFDAGANEYFFWGYDDAFAQRIYSLDIDQGTTIDNPVTPNSHVEMEYNYSNGKVYSFEFDGNENNLVELNLTTGVSTVVSDLADIEATAIGNSTFDPINNLYIGFGVAGNEYRIFGIDVLTGEMVYNSPLSDDDDGLILAFEYDWTNERLLGLRQVSMPDPNNPFEFLIDNYMVEINLATGQATDLFTTPVFSGAGVAVGGVGFDQQSQTYITYVGGDYDLGMINTNTGELFNVVTLGKPFYELQVDNFDYAQSLSVAPTSIKNNFATETILVSPNPVDDELRIDLGTKFEAGNILEVFDINGKQLRTENINSNLIQTSVVDFETGVYFVRIRQGDKVLNAKFTKL
ncbi:MAG: T9SS type A sorting domain-containing protein [Saprospiraceae bacterium]